MTHCWCRDLPLEDWCLDTLLSVATWLALMESRPIVGVATSRLQEGQIGVTTHLLVSRHRSGSLVSRTPIGVMI